MTYARKLILHAPPLNSFALEEFVENCLRDKVALVCVFGDQCELVHDIIDELICGDGSAARDVGPITTWHENQPLSEVKEFANAWTVEGDPSATVEEVKLSS